MMNQGTKIRLILLALLVPFLFLGACQTIPPPVDEFALARAAMNAAKWVDAQKHAPTFWTQAEESFRRARLYYRDRDWENARKEFVQARLSAEKAENTARVIRQKTGEFL